MAHRTCFGKCCHSTNSVSEYSVVNPIINCNFFNDNGQFAGMTLFLRLYSLDSVS